MIANGDGGLGCSGWQIVFFCLAFPAASFPATAALEGVELSREPEWVVPVVAEYARPQPIDELTNGQFYLLVDRQSRATRENEAHFGHFVIQITNEKGLETNSQLQITFDPSFERVFLHEIQVRRQGRVIDHLDTERMRLIQKEDQLEYQLYDGRQTLLYLFEDLRVGDVVEYSFTVTGRNPALGGLYSSVHQLQWNMPVGEFYQRVVGEGVVLAPRLIRGGTLRLDDLSDAGRSEFIVHRHDVQALRQEENQPRWYRGFPLLQVTSARSWQDVVAWGETLYRDGGVPDPALDELVERIRGKGATREERIVAAIRFVQDEIRYLGIELGVGSYEPRAPATTLSRRFGDCKDKTALLIRLLAELGEEAVPVLVNLERGATLEELLPSPTLFDHVIVMLRLDGREYWIDPTASFTGGSLTEFTSSDLGFGLPVRAGAELRAIPADGPSRPTIHATETFDATAGPDAPVLFSVKTTYRGLHANRWRANLASAGREEIAKDFLDYYRDYYPSIEPESGIKISDDRAGNELMIDEHYIIGDHWRRTPDGSRSEADFMTTEIRSYLVNLDGGPRTSPYALEHPVYAVQETAIRLSDTWEIEPEQAVIENANFRFEKTLTFRDNVVRIVNSYRTLKDHVLPEEMDRYREDLERAWNLVDLGLFWQNPQTQAYDPEAFDDRSWFIFGYLGGLLFLTIVTLTISFRSRSIEELESVRFYPVPVHKFVVMNIITFNLYTIYWFARNWRYLRHADGLSVMPVLRGIFSPLFFSSFHGHLRRHLERCGQAGALARPHVYALHVGYIVTALFSMLDGAPSLVSLGAFLFLIPAVHLVLELNGEDREALRPYARYRVRHLLATVLCMHLLVPTILGTLYIIPPAKVVAGEHVPTYEVRFMRRLGALGPDEELKLFYSDHLWDYRADGNGLTDRRVFSYWKKDGDVGTQLKFAYFDEIADLDVKYSENPMENTLVTVTKAGGESFYLFLSIVERRDKTFVNLLRREYGE